ncbi:MAG: hypothetical protein FK734_21410 [Asgard group archaeon]|nr:hypothetical protein [Asgard group archaeon]
MSKNVGFYKSEMHTNQEKLMRLNKRIPIYRLITIILFAIFIIFSIVVIAETIIESCGCIFILIWLPGGLPMLAIDLGLFINWLRLRAIRIKILEMEGTITDNT